MFCIEYSIVFSFSKQIGNATSVQLNEKQK